MYDYSYRSINHQLNIYFYLKIIQEIDVIKSLIFNTEQINLINFIAKPVISNDFEEVNSGQIQQIFKNELDINNVLDNYKKILNINKLEEIDHKLIRILNYEFNNLIDNN